MSRIDELKEELQQAILESDEYKEYKELEYVINQNPELKRIVDEVRRKNFELQYTKEDNKLNAATDELNAQFDEVRQQETVNQYLIAEVSLCHMVQDICLSLVQTVDFNMDFLSD